MDRKLLLLISSLTIMLAAGAVCAQAHSGTGPLRCSWSNPPAVISIVWNGVDTATLTSDSNKASDPGPQDGATDVPPDVVLAWKPGFCAADPNAHDVYLGTDPNQVANATKASPEYKATLNLDANSYDPTELLQLGRTYYWRVDEFNDPCMWKGDVWNFTVADYLVLDDFESYGFEENLITDTWLDTWSKFPFPPWPILIYPTYSMISLGSIEAIPPDPVHSGRQSMLFCYDSTGGWFDDVPYYSEAELDFDPTRDFTEYQVKALVLHFYGDPNADANVPQNQMYLTLGDGSGNVTSIGYGHYPGQDMSHLNEEEWHEWNLDLQDFNDAGVNIDDVNKLIIAFGMPTNGPGKMPPDPPGGIGDIFFDDIRLYRPPDPAPACWHILTQCHGDVDGTGDVKGPDFLALKTAWYYCYPHPLYDPCADFDRDGCVKGADFLVIKDNWYKSVPPDCPPGGVWPP
ncbi:MAG: hypothetical protein ACYS4W_08780 [Planctomycetota bacterium]|jgi:hypothetical protein